MAAATAKAMTCTAQPNAKVGGSSSDAPLRSLSTRGNSKNRMAATAKTKATILSSLRATAIWPSVLSIPSSMPLGAGNSHVVQKIPTAAATSNDAPQSAGPHLSKTPRVRFSPDAGWP